MTILHLIRSFGEKRVGGAEINIHNLVNLITKSSNEKNIIISKNGTWNYSSKKNSFIKDTNKNYNLILEVIKNIWHKEISNIHVHSNGYYIFLGYFIALLIKCKLIIKITRIGKGSLINRNREKFIDIKLFIKRTLFQYICKSNFVYIQILSNSCFDIVSDFSDNIIVFPNLIKRGDFDPHLKIKNTFLISSRLIKRKNIDLTLNKLINLKLENIHIYILGDGPELKRLKSKYKKNKSITSFLGHLEHKDVYDFYAKAEYFINLSDSEGMSNSLIEAMSYGCKCIVTNILENVYTAESYSIYYEKGTDFNSKITESIKLDPKEISRYANSRFSVGSFDSNNLRELYRIDNSNFSCWKWK
tara:strand:- start:1379 stop:2455 length:1077 start_codon:yes stop_codon:yes gene_type:complete